MRPVGVEMVYRGEEWLSAANIAHADLCFGMVNAVVEISPPRAIIVPHSHVPVRTKLRHVIEAYTRTQIVLV